MTDVSPEGIADPGGTLGGRWSERAAPTLRWGHVEEVPCFLDAGSFTLFACLHRPCVPTDRLVVICSSIGAEWKYNYRREVMLARALAEQGVAAARFHYHGTGHSDDGEPDFARLVDDALAVQHWAARQVGGARTAYFGARFGAFVAAVAGRPARSPTLTWGAPATAAQYFRELFRADRVARLSMNGSGPSQDDADARADLARGRAADVLGYTLAAPLYHSASSLVFEQALGTAPRQVKLVAVSSAPDQSRSIEQLAATLRDRSFQVSTAVLGNDGSWWLHSPDWQPEETRQTVTPLVTDTADWLSRALGDDAP